MPAANLWVSTMRHAGVVYDPNGPIVARGKKLLAANSYVDRGQTNDEGYIDTVTGDEHLMHINFPYNPGDVLLIASDGQGADKIIPTMTYETKVNPQRNDAQLNTIGASNLQLKTSNGYSPHMFPEFITDWAYYYGSAARPGFVGRFVVGETLIRAPYWPVSPNAFGGQINASPNGDMPGDIYRLMGGVVLRQAGAAPAYAGYISSAFLLPRGVKNNRIIAPGAEDLVASTGQTGRVFLVGPRPGMTYPVGTTFGAALQIDPIVPVNITFTLKFPDGRTFQTSGVSDAYGSFSGKDKWVLDTPGIYQYSIDANWNGYPAVMPGLAQGRRSTLCAGSAASAECHRYPGNHAGRNHLRPGGRHPHRRSEYGRHGALHRRNARRRARPGRSDRYPRPVQLLLQPDRPAQSRPDLRCHRPDHR